MREHDSLDSSTVKKTVAVIILIENSQLTLWAKVG